MYLYNLRVLTVTDIIFTFNVISYTECYKNIGMTIFNLEKIGLMYNIFYNNFVKGLLIPI